MSTLAVVSTVGAASGDRFAVLIAGIASALAGVFSMAAGEYLSSKSQREIYVAQIENERGIRDRPAEAGPSVAYTRAGWAIGGRGPRVAAELPRATVLLKNDGREELVLVIEEGRRPACRRAGDGWVLRACPIVPILPYLFLPTPSRRSLAHLVRSLSSSVIARVKTRMDEAQPDAFRLEVVGPAAFAGIAGYLFGSVLPSVLGGRGAGPGLDIRARVSFRRAPATFSMLVWSRELSRRRSRGGRRVPCRSRPRRRRVLRRRVKGCDVLITHSFETHIPTTTSLSRGRSPSFVPSRWSPGPAVRSSTPTRRWVMEIASTSARLRVRCVATPGHTPEHVSFLVSDLRRADDRSTFSREALCCWTHRARRSPVPGASRSGSRALLPDASGQGPQPADYVAVFPTHGGGSACTASVVGSRWTTLGFERRHNDVRARGRRRLQRIPRNESRRACLSRPRTTLTCAR